MVPVKRDRLIIPILSCEEERTLFLFQRGGKAAPTGFLRHPYSSRVRFIFVKDEIVASLQELYIYLDISEHFAINKIPAREGGGM